MGVRRTKTIFFVWLLHLSLAAFVVHAFVTNVAKPALRRLLPRCAAGVNVIYSERFLEHKARGYHPENPLRVSVPAQLLKHTPGVRLYPPAVSKEEALAVILKVHDVEYVEEVKALSERGGGSMDADTYVNSATYDVCLLAAAAWMDCVERTLLGEMEEVPGENGDNLTLRVHNGIRRPSFALTRPPGHHALAGQAMGFCIFNFAAVAACYALDRLGCRKVAILDLDAHHGNGHQAFVRTHPSICYASFHQKDAFPMTGLDPRDYGPHGNLLDVPIPAYSGLGTYLPLLDDKVLPFLTAFEPDLLIVSIGYDCLVDDPLAQLALGPQDFTAVGDRLLRAFGREKIVFGLEGGYDPDNVAVAIVSTLKPFL